MCPTTFKFTHTPYDSLVLFLHIVLFYSFMPCYSMVQLYGFVCHTHKALHLIIFWCTHTLLPYYSLLQANLITMLFFGLDMPCDSFDLGFPSNKSSLLFGSNHALFVYVIIWFRFTLLFFGRFSGFVVLWLGLHTHKFALLHCYLGFCWLTHTHKFSMCYSNCWLFIITHTSLGF